MIPCGLDAAVDITLATLDSRSDPPFAARKCTHYEDQPFRLGRYGRSISRRGRLESSHSLILRRRAAQGLCRDAVDASRAQTLQVLLDEHADVRGRTDLGHQVSLLQAREGRRQAASFAGRARPQLVSERQSFRRRN